jgi:hypothetical protein
MPALLVRPRGILRRTAAALAALLTLGAGCSFAGDATAPSARPSSGRVAVAAQIVGAAQADAFSLRVTSGYVRAAGDFVSLGTQTLPLTDARTQQVPVTIDLATCLNDAARRGADQGTGADALCYVRLTVVLLTGERVLDTQIVGPLALRPGGTAVPDRPLALYSVSTVRVLPASGQPPADGAPYRLELGQTLALSAVVQDAAGQPVADRPATWTSEPTSVARVDATSGVVTPVAPGRARVTATAGGREAAVDVQVVPAPAAVTVTGSGTGAGRITSAPAGLDCRLAPGQAPTGACTFTFPGDAAVTLTAVPDAGSSFSAWGGDCAAAAGALTCTVTPSVPRAVVATFTAFRALGVTLAGAGTGTVTTTPAGVDCRRAGGATTGTCTAPFLDATRVTLTAAADPASTFAGWSDGCTGAALTCEVTLDQARTVTATFARRQLTLTLALGGSGGGEVRVTAPASGPGVVGSGVCTLAANTGSQTCTVPVEVGAPLTLTATPGGATAFTAWGGACTASGTASTCTLTATADASVAAVFTLRPVALSVAPAAGNAGAGTVTSGDNAIQCAVGGTTATGTCQADIPVGATVTLTSTPAAQQVFLGWGGDCAAAGTAPTCTLTVRTASGATVRFGAPQALAVTPSGTGGGRVTGGGINCAYANGTAAGTCQASGVFGSQVTLTAAADSASVFAGWDGACTGTGACTVTLDQTRAVSATFTRRTVTVTLSLGGAGDGSVTLAGSAPCTLAAGAGSQSCTRQVPAYGAVQASASPGAESQFTGWSGPCTGTGTCQFFPGSDVTLGAVFTPSPVSIAVSADSRSVGNGAVSSTPAGVSCTVTGTAESGTCASPFAVGATVTLTATPASGFAFAGWSGACASADGPTCTLTVGRTPLAAAVRFTPTSATLTVAADPAGTGAGAVFTTDERLACTITGASASGTCTTTYTALPATVVLRATHDAFNAFDGWSGVTCAEGASSDTCTTTLVVGTTALARFRTLPAVTVTPTAAGTGSGTLTVTSPVSFSCTLGVGGAASACQFTVPQNASVTLSVAPDVNTAGFTFGGACAGQTGASCTFIATGSSNPTVTYTPRRYAVTVASGGGDGGGSVTSAPSGVACTVFGAGVTGTCSSDFVAGSTVTLTATAQTGTSTFAGWGGACAAAGTSATCTLANLQAAQSVTATFNSLNVAVSVLPAAGNVGSGSVTRSGGAESCTITASQRAGTCEVSTPRGTAVTLQATADRLNTFGGWSGVECAEGGQTGTSCTVTPTAATAVRVSFVPVASSQVTIVAQGVGTASVRFVSPVDTTCTIAAGASGVACQLRVPSADSVTLVASPGSGTLSLILGGACAGRPAGSTSCTIASASTDTTVTVTRATSITVAPDVTYPMLHGSFRVWNTAIVSVQGGSVSGLTATVPPGTAIAFSGTWQVGPVTDVSFCPGCVIQQYIAWDPQAAANGATPRNQGLWSGITPQTNPNPGATGSFSWQTTAPTVPGTYYIGVGESLDFSFLPGVTGLPGWLTGSPSLAGRVSFRVVVVNGPTQ